MDWLEINGFVHNPKLVVVLSADFILTLNTILFLKLNIITSFNNKPLNWLKIVNRCFKNKIMIVYE